MTERFDHRDDETRAEDAERPEVLDRPVLDGADDLQTEANRAVENESRDEESASDT
jgi:hypothetical protein